MVTKRFLGQTAIITGSTEGIGLAAAVKLGKEGANIIINGRNESKFETAAKKLFDNGIEEYKFVFGDINRKETIELLVTKALEFNSTVDILINNVGGGTNERWIENITDEDWQLTIDKNLSSAFSLTRSVIPHMRTSGYGRIVNVSSVAGRHKGRLSGPQYSAAKAGLLGLTRHLAWDLAKFNITVNAIAPGFVMTERALLKWNSRTDIEQQEMLSQVPMGRFAQPEEIGSAIAFLASKEASYITGVSLDVNGGSFMS